MNNRLKSAYRHADTVSTSFNPEEILQIHRLSSSILQCNKTQTLVMLYNKTRSTLFRIGKYVFIYANTVARLNTVLSIKKNQMGSRMSLGEEIINCSLEPFPSRSELRPCLSGFLSGLSLPHPLLISRHRVVEMHGHQLQQDLLRLET